MTEAAESGKPDKRSMDEILASIRRIVSDEEDNADVGGGDGGVQAPDQAVRRGAAAAVVQADAAAGDDSRLDRQGNASETMAPVDPAPSAATASTPLSGEDDVLDLIDMVAPDGSVVRIGQASVQHLAGSQEAAATQFATQPNSDLSLPKQGIAQEPAPSGMHPAAETTTPIPLARAQSARQVIEPTDTAKIGLTNVVGAAGVRRGADMENITSALQIGTPRSEHADRTVYPDGQQISSAEPSIEHQVLETLVQRALAPVLNEWLDKNMPAIMEKITAREIRKITDAQR
ncbi:MAG: DUF2497 domain-containing protein [Rhodospirillaceae bacterium]|nr:DUF2497 domain-containing protein [Rhodospirillaceae bacterium]